MADLNLPLANQAQIIRASQRDLFHVTSLHERLEAVLRSLLGTRWLLRWDKEVSLFSKLVYYGLATLHASQTLGEEYTDIWPFVSRYPFSLPYPRKRRIALILLSAFPSYLTSRFLSHFNQRFASSRFLELLKHIPSAWDVAVEINLAIFYFSGTYHELVKRIIGIKYYTTVPPNPHVSPPSYSFLGVMLASRLVYRLISSLRRLHMITQSEAPSENRKNTMYLHGSDHEPLIDSRSVSSILSSAKFEETEQTSALNDENTILVISSLTPEVRSTRRCALCLEERTSSCATECGHIFCWDCISGWGREKAECPLCRQSLDLSRLLPIYNL